MPADERDIVRLAATREILGPGRHAQPHPRSDLGFQRLAGQAQPRRQVEPPDDMQQQVGADPALLARSGRQAVVLAQIDRYLQAEPLEGLRLPFQSPPAITALSKETFVAAAWDVVGRKVSKPNLLGDIYATAQTSIALPVAPDAPAIAMFRLILAEARHLIRQRSAIICWARMPTTSACSRSRASGRSMR